MTDERDGRARRMWQAVRKETHIVGRVAPQDPSPQTGGPASVTTLGTTVAAILSIALGTLAGYSAFHTFSSPAANRA